MTIISRRTALSGLAGLALLPRNVASQERPGAAGPADICQYVYKNSLWDHAAEPTDADVDTNAANWVSRLVAFAGDGNSFRETSEFGFYSQWSLPPASSSGGSGSPSEAPQLDLFVKGTWANMNQVSHVMFVPDNFEGPNHDPDSPNGISEESYQDSLVRFIDAWEANAPYSGPAQRRYLIYSAWTNLPDESPDAISERDWVRFTNDGLGSYLDWMKLLTERVQANRPDVILERVPVTEVVLKARRDTVLNTLPAAALFEDMVHGRETWYLLVGATYYMWAFGKKVPTDYVPPVTAGVHPVLVDNWGAITDSMWAELTTLSN
jgi:hypothetical protein